jgi:hypothetical protein
MKVDALSLGVLAVSATLGLVVAQERPAREPTPAPRGGGPAAAPPERESDVRAITDLLASFVAVYNAKDARALGDDLLTLAQSGQGGALVGRVTRQAEGRCNFRVLGTGPEDQGLSFTH